jgi:uncharacterized membrane protein SpoIIM required for sporulation
MGTRSHEFFKQNCYDWGRLEAINTRIESGGYHSLSADEVRDFPRLYRKASGDLAEARLLELSPDLTEYLNSLLAASHTHLYSRKRMLKGGFVSLLKEFAVRWLLRFLPGALIRNRRYLLASALIFFLSYAALILLVYHDNTWARVFVPADQLLLMEESYSTPLAETRDGLSAGAMAAFYIQHNTSIAFLSFATGVAGGIGTFYFLFFNGIQLGTITGYILSLGYGDNFFNFVTAHSVFELTGLVVAGAAGLLLGYTILAPGRNTRRRALYLKQNDILALVGLAAMLIFMAALIEGFLSPQPIPFFVKLAVFGLALTAETVYAVYVLIRGRRDG